jgi:hypothetical protein
MEHGLSVQYHQCYRTGNPSRRFYGCGVYPNPARYHASFDLVVPQAQPVSISVYDALGKRRSYEEIAQHAEGKRKIDLDLQGLPSGVYILSVQADQQQHNRLFQVVH